MKLHGTNNLLYQFGLVKYNNEVNEILSAIPQNSQFRVFQNLLFSIVRDNFEDVPQYWTRISLSSFERGDKYFRIEWHKTLQHFSPSNPSQNWEGKILDVAHLKNNLTFFSFYVIIQLFLERTS
mgnify:CR=1 FL=1